MAQGKKEEAEAVKKQVTENAARTGGAWMSVRKSCRGRDQKENDDHSEYH